MTGPSHNLIRIAITMGDPCGIGPEVIAAAWRQLSRLDAAASFVVGDPEIMRRAAGALRDPELEVQEYASAAAASLRREAIPVIPVGATTGPWEPGVECAAGGALALAAIEKAVSIVRQNEAEALVTAPISKRALHLAGYTQWPGHTELLADLCGVPRTSMMLYLSPRCPRLAGPIGLGVVHATLHVSLRQALVDLSIDRIVDAARLAVDLAERLLRQVGVTRAPKIGVAAVNPHAGEQGLFGDEESRIIAPAVARGCREGLPLSGPLPCDTLMHRTAAGEFDMVVAMYHDQGHIALKLLGLHQAVNITLGLPMIRTSVAHGTAFDIAWQGRARPDSLVEAVRVAADLARSRSTTNI